MVPGKELMHRLAFLLSPNKGHTKCSMRPSSLKVITKWVSALTIPLLAISKGPVFSINRGQTNSSAVEFISVF